MSNYIRDRTKGGCYFLTFNLADRKSQLLTTHIDKFRMAYTETAQRYRFHLDAMVVLPDHVHILLTLPADSDNYAIIISSLKSQFSRRLNKIESISSSRNLKGERGVWQRRFWEHRIRNDDDYSNHMDYIHYNPSKHGYVTKPQDWQYSTLNKLIENETYPSDWCGGDKIEIIDIHYD